jgi:hypothetical protein
MTDVNALHVKFLPLPYRIQNFSFMASQIISRILAWWLYCCTVLANLISQEGIEYNTRLVMSTKIYAQYETNTK